MLMYEIRLAIKSFKKNPILTALMVSAIALGIGVCMTTVTLYYMKSGNPIPYKSEQLFVVQIDSWSPNEAYNNNSTEMPSQLTWRDAMALRARAPDFPQLAMFRSIMVIEANHQEELIRQESARITGRDFFELFDVGFEYGGTWSQEMENRADHVTVLSYELNEELFGGENSVGRTLRIEDELFEVIGVTKPWHPTPKYHDLNNGPYVDLETFYIPLTLSVPMEIETYGNTSCWQPVEGEGYQALTNSECVWLQYWVQLDNQAEKEEYLQFLEGYFDEQKELGRFQRPRKVALRSVTEWLKINEVVGNDSRVLLGLAFMFLAVCVFNTVGLLLTKFLGRSKETSIRRALGATRGMLLRQHLVEVGSIGISGGIIGVALAWLGLIAVGEVTQAPQALIHMDLTMMAVALVLAIAATLIAGLYPSWHVGRIAPARYLRT